MWILELFFTRCEPYQRAAKNQGDYEASNFQSLPSFFPDQSMFPYVIQSSPPCLFKIREFVRHVFQTNSFGSREPCHHSDPRPGKAKPLDADEERQGGHCNLH